MTTTRAESAPFVQNVAAELAAFLKHYITWHDRRTAVEAAARAAVKAAGGRIITGGQDRPWVDGRTTETYYDQETGEKLGVIVWQNNDMNAPVSSTMEFRDADVHIDHLVDDEDLGEDIDELRHILAASPNP